MLPEVAILIPTFNRVSVLTQNVRSLNQFLKYDGPVKILIGDDSDDPALSAFDNLTELFEVNTFEMKVFQNRPQHRGLGTNLNNLLAKCETDIVLQMDDDHILLKPLDITPHVRKLMEDETAGCIRLMHIAGHKYRANLDGSYWRIDWESPEVYIASNRPHLKHISRFHGVYGFYPEGLKLGLTEESFCHICIDLSRQRTGRGMKSPDVLIPLDVQTESGWDHIGHSWQMEGF